ncbi:MAG: hypothetical protein AAGB22_02305 [Bacteroidota bacterium]
MGEELYNVSVELHSHGNNSWTATVTDAVDTFGLVLLENVVAGEVRTLELQHQEGEGANTFTTDPHGRKEGENAMGTTSDANGKPKGLG